MIPRSKRTPDNWCGFFHKQRHATKKAARAHRAHLLSTSGKDRSRTNILRCGLCDGWHVGRR